MKIKFSGFICIFTLSVFVLGGCSSKEKPATVSTVSTNYEFGENQTIAFSETGYFYQEKIKLEIFTSKSGEIYYTMDGSEPDQSKKLYEKGINLSAEDEVKVYSVKAKAYFEDGTESETLVHTFFVGKEVEDRFDTLVFSVTTDPYNLFDYEKGIFVEGKIREDYIKNNPYDRIEPDDPANYNMRGRESEREVYLEVLEPNGTKITEQAAGIRSYGGWSRANLQKSIKIYARKEYDEVNNKLRYEFFPTKTAANGNGTILDSFKRLVLRGSGNDNGFGFIRDELFQTLSAQAGYKDYEAVRPAVLFINGDYNGCYWLHEVYSDEYFEENYGEYTGAFEILEGQETLKELDDDGSNEEALRDYEEVYSYASMDLTEDNNFHKLCELMDVKNYLEYYALQIYIGNEDWPHNNYKTYRYYPAKGEEFGEAPFDGKWRYLLHDLDFSFGIYGSSPSTDNISNLVGRNGEIKEASPLFGQLMRRADCREIFIRKTLDLVNGAFAPDNINKVLDEMNASRMKEQVHMYGKNLMADWVTLEQLQEKLDWIRAYGSQRAEHVLKSYQSFFGLSTPYHITVQPAKDCEFKVNSYLSQDTYEGNFYSDYNTVVSAILPAGAELDYWLVNGEKVYEKELIITPERIKDGKSEVTFLLKEEASNPHIILSELTANGDEDYVLLFNPYKEALSLQGYSITDDSNNPFKLPLPNRMLNPGESIRILGETNPKVLDKEEFRAEFSFKAGEVLLLYLDSEMIDEVKIPEQEAGSIYQRDLSTMQFYEILPEKD